MKELIKRGVALGLGLAITSKEQAEKIVDELVKKGELNKGESKAFFNELLQKGEQAQKELDHTVHEKIKKILAELDVANKADIQRLEQRIEHLENRSNHPEG